MPTYLGHVNCYIFYIIFNLFDEFTTLNWWQYISGANLPKYLAAKFNWESQCLGGVMKWHVMGSVKETQGVFNGMTMTLYDMLQISTFLKP